MIRMKTSGYKYGLLLLALTGISPLHVVYLQAEIAAPQAPRSEIDRRKLEELEDKSEDVANGLLELAVALRDGDTKKVAEYFADPAQTTLLPSAPTRATPHVKWAQRHGWNFEPKKTETTMRAELAGPRRFSSVSRTSLSEPASHSTSCCSAVESTRRSRVAHIATCCWCIKGNAAGSDR